MQILLLAMLLGISVHDALGAPPAESWLAGWPWYVVLAVAVGPKALLLGGYALTCRRVYRKLGKPGAIKALTRLSRLTTAIVLLALPLYALDLAGGLLRLLRDTLHDPILLDELGAMLPTLGLIVGTWWAYYPIDRRLRDAAILRRADQGLPIRPPVTRWQYVLSNIRHQFTLILAPLLLIWTWSELVTRTGPDGWRWVSMTTSTWLTSIGALSIFLFAPVMIRYLWDTVPLPAGEVRDRLLAMCDDHGVGVRRLLLWRTQTGMINAAVMGLLAPVRYILITDALLEQLPQSEVEAVMAHELAHVKKKHLFWLIGVTLGSFGLFEMVLTLGVDALAHTPVPAGSGYDLLRAAVGWLQSQTNQLIVIAGGVAVGWLGCLGWVSRRAERQADTFAVRHMAQRHTGEDPAAIDPAAVAAMVGALQRLADLNVIPVKKRSWRHGSIAWRQAYLRTLVGADPRRLAIDRQMRWINLATLAALAICGWSLAQGGPAPL